MEGVWEIVNNSLVLRVGEDVITPSAEEIFLAQFYNKKEIRNIKVVSPSENVSFLTFSKYPINLKLLLSPEFDEEVFSLKANIIIELNGSFMILDSFLNNDLDHVVFNNVWYPVVVDVKNEIMDLLRKAAVSDLPNINLKQYLILKKLKSHLVIDTVQEIPVDKKEFLSKNSKEIPRFRGELYNYQMQGYNWLKMIVNENAGCILADEMGLGKTPQIIAVMASELKDSENPTVVIAPVSLLENWRRELDKFAPSLKVLVHQGPTRTGFHKEFNQFDIILTSYETVSRDLSLFKMIKWNLIVADEAQALKNPLAKRTQAIKEIKCKAAIAVTGTPLENNITDIWSLTDFVFPGYLGNIRNFLDEFSNELESAQKLEPLISPILLRRRVKDVANDLPERIDIPQAVKLTNEEAILYENLRQGILKQYGKSASIVSLIKLRMYSAHPFLQFETDGKDPTIFSKYVRLIEILEEIVSLKEKAIIFTSFTQMSDVMLADLSNRFNIHCDFIDGRVKVAERQNKIDIFSNINGAAFLILNPRAAGAGLNITAANHVIHYNLEWNPAVEDQASARAHRRGQTRPVSVHRLFCADTVEEVINEKLEHKREVSEAAVIGTDGIDSDQTDILEALWRSPLE